MELVDLESKMDNDTAHPEQVAATVRSSHGVSTDRYLTLAAVSSHLRGLTEVGEGSGL